MRKSGAQLSKIHPELMQILGSEDNDPLGFTPLNEGNYDIDRLDYLLRDCHQYGIDLNDYTHSFPSKRVFAKIDEKGNVMTDEKGRIILDNEAGSSASQPIYVYPANSLLDIEVFLQRRAQAYRHIYFSERIQVRDSIVGQFVKAVIDTDDGSKSAKDCKTDLKGFINMLKSQNDEIDLETYLSWNDITFYNSCLDIIEDNLEATKSSPDDRRTALVEFAVLVMHDIVLITDYMKHYLRESGTGRVEPTDEDRNFLERLMNLIKTYPDLERMLENRNFFQDNCFWRNDDGKLEEGWVRCHIQRIKSYDSSTPIYVESQNGGIYQLENHPNRTRNFKGKDITEEVIPVGGYYTTIPMLRLKGMSDEEREIIASEGKVPELQFTSNHDVSNHGDR